MAAEARIVKIVADFTTYRARWNAAIAKHAVNGNIRISDLVKIEAEAGMTKLEMLSAKARIGQ
jgi:hypothetical protein